MIFGYPQDFWLLAIVIPVGFVLWARYRSGKRELARLGGEWRESAVMNTYVVKWFFSSLAFVAFILLSVFSIVDPRWGERTIADEPNGTDIVFAIDISRSMRSIDIPPSRLERTALAVKGIMNGIPGGRFGVVIFKGTGIRAIPLTEDQSAIENFVDGMQSGLITAPGTNIQAGISAALESFPEDVESQRFIILLSDGGATTGSIEAAVEDAQNLNVTVIGIGVGGEKLVPIPLGNDQSVTDQQGEIVYTKLEAQDLVRLAEATEGIYTEIRDPAVITNTVGEVRQLTRRRLLQGFTLVSNNRYRIFAFVAVLCVLLYQGIRIYRWKGSL